MHVARAALGRWPACPAQHRPCVLGAVSVRAALSRSDFCRNRELISPLPASAGVGGCPLRGQSGCSSLVWARSPRPSPARVSSPRAVALEKPLLGCPGQCAPHGPCSKCVSPPRTQSCCPESETLPEGAAAQIAAPRTPWGELQGLGESAGCQPCWAGGSRVCLRLGGGPPALSPGPGHARFQREGLLCQGPPAPGFLEAECRGPCVLTGLLGTGLGAVLVRELDAVLAPALATLRLYARPWYLLTAGSPGGLGPRSHCEPVSGWDRAGSAGLKRVSRGPGLAGPRQRSQPRLAASMLGCGAAGPASDTGRVLRGDALGSGWGVAAMSGLGCLAWSQSELQAPGRGCGSPAHWHEDSPKPPPGGSRGLRPGWWPRAPGLGTGWGGLAMPPPLGFGAEDGVQLCLASPQLLHGRRLHCASRAPSSRGQALPVAEAAGSEFAWVTCLGG